MAVRLFVTGTDTGVGKTEVAAALLELLAGRGERPFALKPFESGGGDDARRLGEAAGGWQSPSRVCLYRLRAPLAPAMAARVERRRISWARVRRALARLGPGSGVVEGAGGVHVPLDADHDVIDLIAEYRLPVVLVARAGLGTINHTVLTLQALGRIHARVAAVVLLRSSPGADRSIPFNRPELERRFPALAIYGPVPFLADEGRRRRALRRELAPLIASLAGGTSSRPSVRAVSSARPGKEVECRP
jgi:dethiobiotin synthetase